MAALVFVAIGVTISWFEQPPRITEQFVGETYHERYEDAVPMLLVPSAVSVESDGGLVIVDRTGRSVSVTRVTVPFLAGGHDGAQKHDSKMTAPGPGTDGILHGPAVTLSLSIVNDEVAIEAVER